ncbi:MAG: ATP-binding protein [Bryobacteraceae bacterium]
MGVPVSSAIEGHERAEETLRRRLELETLVAEVSSRFINLEPSEINDGISFALKAIGEFAGADRSYVFRLAVDGKTASNTHEWCAPGIEPQISVFQNLNVEDYRWGLQRLLESGYICVPRVHELPPEAEPERENLLQGIESVVIVALISGGRLIGLLGIESVRKERAWDDDHFALLKMLAGILVSGLERKRSDDERSRLEGKLREAQKLEAVGRLAGGVAHDFNNLLTVILGHTEILEDYLSEDAFLSQQVRQIREAAGRAAKLTQQLLAFSRKQVLKQEVLDLNSAVKGMEQMLRSVLGENIVLVTELDPALGSIKADHGQIEQVLLNLSLNARDAMPGGGRLTIRTARRLPGPEPCGCGTKPAEDCAVLTVTDTGCGMDEETKSHIFEPFFTTKSLKKGTGLGLPTVYGIVRQHGGGITVRSASGRGSEFEIRLPAVREKPCVNSTSSPKLTVSRPTETVLLVEDDENIRTLIRRVLVEDGYTVLDVPDSDGGKLIAERHAGPIQLLLTDIVLAKGNGRELAEYVAPLRPETKVLFMSGYPGQTQVPANGLAFLQKPFTPGALRQKLREVLDSRG